MLVHLKCFHFLCLVKTLSYQQVSFERVGFQVACGNPLTFFVENVLKRKVKQLQSLILNIKSKLTALQYYCMNEKNRFVLIFLS